MLTTTDYETKSVVVTIDRISAAYTGLYTYNKKKSASMGDWLSMLYRPSPTATYFGHLSSYSKVQSQLSRKTDYSTKWETNFGYTNLENCPKKNEASNDASSATSFFLSLHAVLLGIHQRIHLTRRRRRLERNRRAKDSRCWIQQQICSLFLFWTLHHLVLFCCELFVLLGTYLRIMSNFHHKVSNSPYKPI